jgi:hypothetical protein
MNKPFSEVIQIIEGCQLSSVTFVMDYWQLAFDGHVFSILTWLSVSAGGKAVRSGATGFRDALCEQITKIVQQVLFADLILAIKFEDGSVIQAFARPEDYRYPCPEALIFQSHQFKTLYVI